ncbi:MAG: four helix bundle protein [Chitinophagaceae bacterium]|nr:four helix bundle protein [Chitinophagaceae bacterium]MCW5904326.1 four helix bundle protein [Chitinophagaceae bacterium]
MAFRFEELKIWQQAFELSNEIDLLSQTFPKRELFSLSSQIKRAADSVALNIAEGCIGQSTLEFKRFLGFSLRSAIEVVSCLFMAKARNYIEENVFKSYYEKYEVLCKMITKFRATL